MGGHGGSATRGLPAAVFRVRVPVPKLVPGLEDARQQVEIIARGEWASEVPRWETAPANCPRNANRASAWGTNCIYAHSGIVRGEKTSALLSPPGQWPRKPALVFADEPTAALDPGGKRSASPPPSCDRRPSAMITARRCCWSVMIRGSSPLGPDRILELEDDRPFGAIPDALRRKSIALSQREPHA